ncbi:hypothetical protein DFH09DRAFT_1066931 [Mycena vulgaris]|nr:hypothetical protein DFH09DRAFT_1066931 [Mycena vulgaris]
MNCWWNIVQSKPREGKGRNNISKWTLNRRDMYGMLLMGTPVSHRFPGKSSTSSTVPVAKQQIRNEKTERRVGRTIHEVDVLKRGEVEGTEHEPTQVFPAAEGKHEAKCADVHGVLHSSGSARFRDRNSALAKKTTQGGHFPNIQMTRPWNGVEGIQ